MSPSVHHPLTSVTVQAGDTAVLTCRIYGRPRPSISWLLKGTIPLVPNTRTTMTYGEDGVATLQINQVTILDSGEYTYITNSDIGGVVTKTTLTVLDRPGPPSQPQIKNQVGTSVHLEWSPPTSTNCGQIHGYTVEFHELGVDYWQPAIPYVPNTSQLIGDLTPGSSYQFRVSANNTIGMSDSSMPSDYVTIPTEYELSEKEYGNYALWKTTYDNDFREVEEMARGRFAVLKRCVQTEFNTLQSLQHEHLFDLYETSHSYMMVMEFRRISLLRSLQDPPITSNWSISVTPAIFTTTTTFTH